MEAVIWLALGSALLAAIRQLMVIPRKVVSVIGTVLTAAFLGCAVMVYPLSGAVVDRAGDDWQFQWGWWVPILAGPLSAVAIWFDHQLHDAGWEPLATPRR